MYNSVPRTSDQAAQNNTVIRCILSRCLKLKWGPKGTVPNWGQSLLGSLRAAPVVGSIDQFTYSENVFCVPRYCTKGTDIPPRNPGIIHLLQMHKWTYIYYWHPLYTGIIIAFIIIIVAILLLLLLLLVTINTIKLIILAALYFCSSAH